jgi:UDP-GlcNAc:undecaprenyl-phosphate/decaprenyl-phosphate GlcNAc-1-phosphate transferase
LTPVMRKGAFAFGILDRPDGRLKQQREPVPYLGGLAVYLAFLLTLALVFDFRAQLLGLLLGATLAVMLGLFDDFHVLPPALKFIGQLVAAGVLIKSDIAIQLVAVPTWIELPLSVFWLVGITNAINILDVFDGLATGVGAIAAFALSVAALLNEDWVIATTGLALTGSLLGFWPFNRPPAKIYLGDAGSLFIGVMLAARAMTGASPGHSFGVLFAPIVFLRVPFLEPALVTLTRLYKRLPPWRGSPDHMALRLKNRGWSAHGILVFAYVLSALGATLGIAITVSPPSVAIVLDAVLAIIFLALLVWLAAFNQAPSTAALEHQDPNPLTRFP